MNIERDELGQLPGLMRRLVCQGVACVRFACACAVGCPVYLVKLRRWPCESARLFGCSAVCLSTL